MISALFGIHLLSCGIIGWFFGKTGWVARALLRVAPWGCWRAVRPPAGPGGAK
jgi:hypothetical protein